MKEYERWKNIQPLYLRFIEYAKYHEFGANRRLCLRDLLNEDLVGEEYFHLVVELAYDGYELELVEGNSKYRRGLGLKKAKMFSYFELKSTKIRQELDQKKVQDSEINSKLVMIVNSLSEENNSLKKFRSKISGPKISGDESLINLLYREYLDGKSLNKIIELLKKSEFKTKTGGKWHRSTVKFMLNNYRYVECGYVTKEAYDEVQQLLIRQKK